MIRVASVPGSHVYVRHLSHPDVADVERLPDPVPRDGRTVPGGWWPPLMLEPDWVQQNHRSFDVFHVHFGFDSLTPEQLAEVVRLLRLHDKPLIYTAHDLRNPHQRDSKTHADLLDVLVPAADALITLTPGARDEIDQRWGRQPTVLPHPHVVPPECFTPRSPRGEAFVIGIHAKSLRANMDPISVIEALVEQLPAWPEAILQINVHDEIFQPDNHWYAPEVGRHLLDLGQAPQTEVRVHPYFSDEELWAYLASLDVSVLPYRFGTHSGWLEACHDLGTGVVVSDCGFYGEQRPCEVYGFNEQSGLDVASLLKAVDAFRGQPPERPTWRDRWDERRFLAQAHADLYRSLL
jgi:hypothetical protein